MFKEYIPHEMPANQTEGLMFAYSNDRSLDVYGQLYKVERRQWFFIKEPDMLYKTRLRNKAVDMYLKGESICDYVRIPPP